MTEAEYVSVPVGCPHPGTPHDGHSIFLLPKLTYEGGAATAQTLGTFVRKLNGSGISDEQSYELGVLLGKDYLEHQAVGWDMDEEFSVSALLGDWTLSRPVAEKADELYSGAVLDPLVKAVAASSRNGRTAQSTSARKRRTAKPRTP